MDEIRSLCAEGGAALNNAKKVLAYTLTAQVHGEEEAGKASQAAEALFGGGGDLSNIPTIALTPADIEATGLKVTDLLVMGKLAKSKSDARRLIEAGSVLIGDEKVTDVYATVNDPEVCKGCSKCARSCPVNAIKHEDGAVVLDREICNNCGKCIDKCPFDAIEEDKRGYRIYLGGKWGKSVRRGTPIDRIFTEDEVMSIIEKALLIYREQGITGERFGVTVDRIGFDSFVAQLLKDDILERKQAILDAQLHLVGGAQC